MKSDREWTVVPTKWGPVPVTRGVLRVWEKYGMPTDESLRIIARDHAGKGRR